MEKLIESIIEEFSIEEVDDKTQIEIEFEVDEEKDDFKCHLTISYDKYAILIIISNNKLQIRFRGTISEMKDE